MDENSTTPVELEQEEASAQAGDDGVLTGEPARPVGPDELPETAADTTGEAYTESARREDQEEPATDVLDLISEDTALTASDTEEARKIAVLEAIIYVTDEPLTAQQIATAMNQPVGEVKRLLNKLVDEFNRAEHGLTVKEIAGGYKMATKPEHHEAVRQFVKNLNPPMKLSLAALETLAVIAYKQPITAPEIMEIRGVQGAGVLKTLLDRKLITSAGRKSVIGKPILYKTTKDFLVQFGLKDLSELPSLKEFEELRRLAFSETEEAPPGAEPPPAEPGAAAAGVEENADQPQSGGEASSEEKQE
jgi:segregation and condensation protein B